MLENKSFVYDEILNITENLINDKNNSFLKYDINQEKIINLSDVKSSEYAIYKHIEDYITSNIELYNSNRPSELDLILNESISNQFIFFNIKSNYLKCVVSFSGSNYKDSEYILLYCENSTEYVYAKFINFYNKLNKYELPIFIGSIIDNHIYIINKKGIELINQYPKFISEYIFPSNKTYNDNDPSLIKIKNQTDGYDYFIIERNELEIINDIPLKAFIINNYNHQIEIQNRYLDLFDGFSSYAGIFDIIPWHYDSHNNEIVIEFDKSNKVTDLFIEPITKRINLKKFLNYIYSDDSRKIIEIIKEGKSKKFLNFETIIRVHLWGETGISTFKLMGMIDNRDSKGITSFGFIKNDNKSLEENNEFRKLNIEAQSLHIFQTAFLEIIHNELRNPVNKLIGYTELIISDKKKTDENRELYYNKIKYYKDKLLSLLESSLEYSYNEPILDTKNKSLSLNSFLDLVNEVISSRDRNIHIDYKFDKEIVIASYKTEKLAVAISCLVFCHLKKNNNVKPIIYAKVKDSILNVAICSENNIDKINDNISCLSTSQYISKSEAVKNIELDINIALSYSKMVDAKLKFLHNFHGEDIFIIETKIEYIPLKNEFTLKLANSLTHKYYDKIILIESDYKFSDSLKTIFSNRYNTVVLSKIDALYDNYIGDSPFLILVNNINNSVIKDLESLSKSFYSNKKLIISMNNRDNFFTDNKIKSTLEQSNYRFLKMPYMIEDILKYLYEDNNINI